MIRVKMALGTLFLFSALWPEPSFALPEYCNCRQDVPLDYSPDRVTDIARHCTPEQINWYVDNSMDFSIKPMASVFAGLVENWDEKKEVLEVLVKRGFGVNVQDENGDTALMIEAEKNNLRAVRILLNLGANQI